MDHGLEEGASLPQGVRTKPTDLLPLFNFILVVFLTVSLFLLRHLGFGSYRVSRVQLRSQLRSY